MNTEVISTNKLETIVLDALDNLMTQIGKEAEDGNSDSQDLNARLQAEFDSLGQRTKASNDSGKQYFAELIVSTVEAVHRLTPDDALALLKNSEATNRTPEGNQESKVSSDWNNLPTNVNTSGWDGRTWRSAAEQLHTPTKNSYIEFRENAKDVLVDFLRDGIKETLTKEALDFVVNQAKAVISLVLGQGVVMLLSQTPILLSMIGFVLLFLLSHFQSDAASVPDDCACIWDHICRICKTAGFARPSDVISSFRSQGLLHPRPHNLAPCKTLSLKRIPSCPFRYPNQQGRSCCQLAYDTDPSFGTETRDDKILRAFKKLENLGLIETKINHSPACYFLT